MFAYYSSVLVSPVDFFDVHEPVGVLEQAFSISGVFRVEGGTDRAAATDVRGADTYRLERLAQEVIDVLAHDFEAVAVSDLVDQDHEFVSSVARYEVALPQIVRQACGDLL